MSARFTSWNRPTSGPLEKVLPLTTVRRIILPLLICLASLLLACAPPTTTISGDSPPSPTALSSLTPTHATGVAATPTQPRPTPSGQIVYTCQLFAEELRDQICLMSPDGSGKIRLTTEDQADHFYPSLAPSGQSVLYSANLAGPHEIYEQELDGEPRRLTVQGNNYAPAVSPDGSLIVYTHTEGPQAALWLMDRDGSRPRYFLGDAWDATWSPDGAWILHASQRSGSIQLWRVRPDGSQLRQVTELEGLRGRNDWSPHGRLATYAGHSWQREIFTFDVLGREIRQLTEGGNNLAPSFSPNGEWIVFTSYADRYRDENGCEIYRKHLESGTVVRLTENDFCDWQPRWGPG